MKRLADLTPGKGARGAGIIARHEGRLVFLAERTERSPGELVCIRVGGNCRGGESFVDCAVREAGEEIGSDVVLQHSRQTFVVDESGDVTVHAVQDAPAPLLLYTKQRPDVTPHSYHNALFAASLAGAPRPGPEAETLLFLPDEALLALAERPQPLFALQAAGARVESIRPPSPDAIVLAEVAPRHLAALLRRGVRIE